MASLPAVFASTLLLSFGISLFLAGLFGAYFGKGRSRSVGFVLTLVATLLLGLFASLTWPLIPGLTPVFDAAAVGQALMAVLAATTGTFAAIGTFVLVVMKN